MKRNLRRPRAAFSASAARIGAGEESPHCPEHQVANLHGRLDRAGAIRRGTVVDFTAAPAYTLTAAGHAFGGHRPFGTTAMPPHPSRHRSMGAI